MTKILIVDDDKRVTSLLERYLTAHHYEVTAINHSSRAIQTANLMHPDLFILDIMMPHPDGYALCKSLRADPNFSQTPILIITALDNSNSSAATFGANAYLTKPFDLDELISNIEAILHG